MTRQASPSPSDVLSMRERLQEHKGIGITQAQRECAVLLHTSLRSWQQWERGERKMHPAFFELIKIKLNFLF